MYGQMTAGSLDLHRHPGDSARHVRDVRGGRERAFRWVISQGAGGYRRSGRHGRSATAGGDDERRRVPCASRWTRRGSSDAFAHGISTARADNLDEALRWVSKPQDARRPLSVGRAGQLPRIFRRSLFARGDTPDLLTDQTSAHDALDGYVPNRMTFEGGGANFGGGDPDRYIARVVRTMADHVQAHARNCRGAGRSRSTTATTFAARRELRAWTTPSTSTASCRAYIRPLFCEGKGPFRWAAAFR